MESNFAPSKIVEKLKELNKNCVIILGSEPVVSNHIKKEIRSFTDLHNIEYQFINFEISSKINEVKALFENESLFSNQFLYGVSFSGGRVLEDVKKFLVKLISENTNDLFIVHFQKPTKELLKSAWFQEINKKSIQLEAKEPNSYQIQQAIKARADFHNLNIDSESISLLSNLSLGNLLAAENEIIKLSLVELGSDIDIKKLISHISNGSKFDSFKLLDYCISGQIQKTAQSLSYFEEEGVEPLMLNGLFSWMFTAISKLKFSSDESITNSKLMELRIFGTSQDLVRNALNTLSINQIEASILKIKEIDLICKGINIGNPWLEINRFSFGIARLFNNKKVK
jgi:DNA polymerase-3 subunit delta